MCRITFSPQALGELQLKKKNQQEIKQALESSENPEHLAYNWLNNSLVLWSYKALSVYLCSIYICIHSKHVYDIHKSYVEKNVRISCTVILSLKQGGLFIHL